MGYSLSLFSGLSAFPVTPADVEGRVDCEHFSRLINRLRRDKIASIGVLGSTGSYMYLSLQERDRALRAAVEAAGDTPVLAGIGALRTSDVLSNVRSAEEAGAKGLLLAPVSYLPLTDADVTSLVKDVAAVTELPLCFYNNPKTTGFTLSEDLLIKLANDGLILGVKNPAPPNNEFAAQIDRLSAGLPDEFSLGYSGDATISGALLAGTDVWYSVIAGTLPSISIELWNARENLEELEAINMRLTPLWGLFNTYGGIRIVHEIIGMIGLGEVAPPLPVLPLDANVRAKIEQALTFAKVTKDVAA